MNNIVNSSMRMMQSNMQAMLAADAALSRAQIQGRAADTLEGRANVLESEIKTGNGNLEAMKEKMDNLREAAQGARGSQANTLGEAIGVFNRDDVADKKKETEKEKEEEQEGRYDEVTITASASEAVEELIEKADALDVAAAGSAAIDDRPGIEILGIAADFVPKEDVVVQRQQMVERTDAAPTAGRKEMPDLPGERIYNSDGSIQVFQEDPIRSGQGIRISHPGKYLPEDMDYSRRFDIVETEEVLYGQKTFFIGPDEAENAYLQEMAYYYDACFKKLLDIAKDSVGQNDPALLKKGYEEMQAELEPGDDYQAYILRQCYKTGIGWYSTFLKQQAYDKAQHWAEMGKDDGYAQQAEELKEDLLANGFVLPFRNGKMGAVSGIVHAFTDQALQSLLINAGFQPSKPLEGKLMSASEIQYFRQKYDGIL